MKYFLVSQDCDYADEFDVNGFRPVQAESKEDLLKSLEPDLDGEEEEGFWPREKYFGTNKAIKFVNLKDYLNSFNIKEISEDEYNTVKKLFGNEYGTFLKIY